MLNSFFLAAGFLAKRPQLVILPLAAATLLLGIVFLALDTLADLASQVLFLGIVPETGFLEFPWHLYLQYSWHFNILALLLLIAGIVFGYLNVFLAAYAKTSMEKQESITSAISHANSMITKIFAAAVFFGIIIFSLSILLWLSTALATSLGAIGILLPTIFAIITIFLYITLVFVFPVMGFKKATLREAIEKSASFSRKRALQVFVLVLLVNTASSLIMALGESVSGLVPDDFLGAIVFGFFWAVALCYSGLVVPVYYLRKSQDN